ncbi:cutinase family protein [Nocardia sp. NPDC050435]|uniref:cutinase family protein n=1 Tax=Nocardia sp. NPDC050435 TaxID=3155040 RepID=UPI0033D587D1
MTTLRVLSGATAAALAAATYLTAGTAVAQADSADCPIVYALGVQGTGQSSPGASTTDDTGFLSTVFVPLQAAADAAKVAVKREYIPYEAAASTIASASKTSYADSVTGGAQRLRTRISDIARECRTTRIALVGYSQGAHVVSQVAQSIGQTGAPIAADRVVGVALFGDPTRTTGATTFPGAPNAQRPAAAPGLAAEAVAGIDELVPIPPAGTGITSTRSAEFGKLVGRVASFCTAGDLSCDAPAHAPLLQAVANVASTVQNPGDPLQALGAIATALATTSIKTASTVLTQDVSGTSLSSLSLAPKKSISQRIADASDPATPVNPGQVVAALAKLGTIGLNAAITVGRSVLTPANIAEIGVAGLADPIAGLAVFGGKLLASLAQLIPLTTGIRWVQEVFTAFTTNLTDNQDMFNATTWVKYSDVINRHGSYVSDPVTPAGGSAVTWVADWFTAAARDVAATPAARPATATGKATTSPARPSTNAPRTTTPAPAPSSVTVTPPSSSRPITTTPNPA